MALTIHLGDDVRATRACGPTSPREAGPLWCSDLCSAYDELVGEVHAFLLYRFITRTLALVQLGTESEWLDVDGVVAQLLGSEAQ